jgi:hypothetical protein
MLNPIFDTKITTNSLEKNARKKLLLDGAPPGVLPAAFLDFQARVIFYTLVPRRENLEEQNS